VTIAAIVTVVKRQVSKKSGAEYARLVLEDFHGSAEALVFPEAWASLNQAIQPDAALLLTGSYSPRDRHEEKAPFIVETVEPLADFRPRGAIGVALRWSAVSPPPPATAREVAALCAEYPGPAPVLLEWDESNGPSNGNGAFHPQSESGVRLRSRTVRVDPGDELLAALRALLGPERVRLVKAG
jgi:DNA polymerase-3 subunit alpha